MKLKLDIEIDTETFHKLQAMHKAFEKSQETVLSFPDYIARVIKGAVKMKEIHESNKSTPNI